MIQNDKLSNEMWIRKEKRDIFTRVVNTIIMRGIENSLPTSPDEICRIAKQITDSAFEFYPEPEEIIPITDKNEFEV